MRFVQLARHDEEHIDVFAVPEHHFRAERFSVLVPMQCERSLIYDVAIDLAAWIKLTEYGEAFVDKRYLYQQHRRLQEQARIAAEIAARPAIAFDAYAAPRLGRSLYVPLMEPTAEQKASALLESIDSELHRLMEGGQAFYFQTTEHLYIWYPNDRAIVSLDEDRPHYVCVHSTDYAVESNKYDWAITMRTYLLGAEGHWRSKANFHNEFRLRGGLDAYRSKDLLPKS